MKIDFFSLCINQKRFRARFEELSTIGATADKGVNRPALGDSHLAARHWFLDQAKKIGLETKIDGAGNHSAILSCEKENPRTLLIGSHLDSVPYGGRFDGALGIIAALEVLQIVKENSIPIKTNLQVIDFTDEEGRFVGLMGSQAFSGLLTETNLQNPGNSQQSFEHALAKSGLTISSILSAKANPETIVGYLELHVEQGNRLFDKNIILES